jgi:LysR family transcriptional regulator, glycine cleavage system transcriptional activator
MTERLPPLNALKAFESAARHLSFKRAAEELSVTPAAISHQIKALEDYVGAALFQRLSRGLELTPAASAALPKLSEGFGALADAVAHMRPQPDSGELTVSVAPSLAVRWLMPRLHRFFAAQPDLDVRINARTRLVNKRGQDNAVERATVETWLENSDVAILYGHGDYTGFRFDNLFALTLAPICSPQLVHGENPLRRPQDLLSHTLVHDDTGALYDGVPFWDVWLKAAGVDGVDTSHGSHFSQPALALEAASDALGVVATFPVLAAAELAVGRLILPFELQVPLKSAYYLVCPDSSMRRPAVTAFRDWLLAEAAHEAAY